MRYTEPIRSPGAVRDACAAYAGRRQEHGIVLTLDSGARIIRRRVVAIGTADRAGIHPRDVYWPAVHDNAVSIVFVHNHPSGELAPSDDDTTMTRRLVLAGEALGIELRDHVIISRRGFYSYREHELL